MPIVLGGYSRGSYATAWAMQKNFVADCDDDRAEAVCAPPKGNRDIKGAILYGPNAGGLGYRAAGQDMEEAALRTEFNVTYRLGFQRPDRHRSADGHDRTGRALQNHPNRRLIKMVR